MAEVNIDIEISVEQVSFHNWNDGLDFDVKVDCWGQILIKITSPDSDILDMIGIEPVKEWMEANGHE